VVSKAKRDQTEIDRPKNLSEMVLDPPENPSEATSGSVVTEAAEAGRVRERGRAPK
jgi:hypothetical protein